MNAVIIDDEKYCAEALQLMLEKYCPEVKHSTYITQPELGIDYLSEKACDILFLDIEMPGMSGFDFLAQIPSFEGTIVFTTAYENYALRAFQVNALGYLLKPIEKEELQKVVKKIAQNQNPINPSEILDLLHKSLPKSQSRNPKVAIHTFEGIHIIETENIIRCESDGSYSRIFLNNQEVLMVSKNLKELEKLFTSDDFYRVHRSHLVNRKHIRFISKQDGGELKMIDDSIVPISRSIKGEFLSYFSQANQ